MANLESQIQDLCITTINNTMTNSLCFSDFGKAASDLFKSDCGINTKMFMVSTLTTCAKAFKSNVAFRRQRSDACLEAICKSDDITFCARTHTKSISQFSGYLKLDKVIGKSSSEAKISLRYPYFGLIKLRLLPSHQLGTLAMDIGLNRSPKMTLQASLGTQSLALGGALEHLIGSPSLRRLKFGIQASQPSFIFTTHFFPLHNKLRGSCVRYLGTDKKLCVALKTHYNLATNQNSCMAGGAWSVVDDGRSAVLKAMIDKKGRVTTCLHCHMKDHKFWVSISSAFNINDMNRWPKIGFNVAITP